MEAILSTKHKIERLKDAFYHGECTYQEYVRLVEQVRKHCKHERKGYYSDDYDVYVWCRDCEDEL